MQLGAKNNKCKRNSFKSVNDFFSLYRQFINKNINYDLIIFIYSFYKIEKKNTCPDLIKTM